MHAGGLIAFEKPVAKILTQRGRFNVGGGLPRKVQTCKTGASPTSDQLFEGSNSYLWSMVYILTFSDSIEAFIEDEEVKEAFNSASMDMLTDILYKPLHKESWSHGKPRIDLKSIENVLDCIKTSSARYKSSPTVLIFLNLLLEGVQKFRQPQSMEEEELPSYTGIYKLFKFVGGLSNNFTAHLAEIDLKYRNQSFLIRDSSQRRFVFSVYSMQEFCDKKVSTLEKLHLDFTKGFEDVLVYDLKTGMKVEDNTLLYKCTDKKLAFSSLITNIWGRDPVATFKFESDSPPACRDRHWFLVTCELGDRADSIWHSVRGKMEKLVKCKDWSKVYFKAEINGEIARASEVGLLDLMKKAYKWRDQMFDKLIILKFEVECKYTITGQETIQIKEQVGPDTVLDEFYKMNSAVRKFSEHSSQLLLVEYGDKIGLDNEMLCKDINSQWLEERKWYYYQLRGVIVQDRTQEGRTLTLPIVKLSEHNWYNPYHNYSMSSLDPTENIKTYIYERSM